LFEAGVAHVPMGNGLGVEVDEDFLRSTKIDERKLFD
jgi:L-alanine-DL-glutamate epimerase-like enolase superfamily enzyme